MKELLMRLMETGKEDALDDFEGFPLNDDNLDQIAGGSGFHYAPKRNYNGFW